MLKTLLLPIALLGAACSQPADTSAKYEMGEMRVGESATRAAAGPISAAGTVTAVDATAGKISLNHDPIAAIGWPAMTMAFNAENPAILQGIAVGDRITFELKSANETGTITMVQKQ